MSTLPSLSDELNRKSLEAMTWLAEQYEAGQITEAEFYIGRSVAFQIINGLVPQDISELTWAEKPARFEGREDVRLMVKDGEEIIVRQRMGDDKAFIYKIPVVKARKRLSKPLSEVVNRLTSMGWLPLEDRNA